jgi:hypothetical protein
VADDRGDVLAGDRPLLARQLDSHPAGDAVELLVELVAADPTEVVAAEVEEQALDELAGVVAGRRVTRAELLVDLDQGFLLGLRQVLVEGVRRERMIGVGVDAREEGGDRVVVLVADGPQQGRRRDLALAVDLDPELVLVVGLELEPGAAVRDDLGREQPAAARGILELSRLSGRACVYARPAGKASRPSSQVRVHSRNKPNKAFFPFSSYRPQPMTSTRRCPMP